MKQRNRQIKTSGRHDYQDNSNDKGLIPVNKRRKRHSSAYYKKKKLNRKRLLGRELTSLALAFLLACLIILTAIQLTYSFGKMDGYSMMPLINHKDIVLASRHTNLSRFDLVYIKVPGKEKTYSIRRIVGLPGDTLDYRNNDLFINNEGRPERYLNSRKKELGEELLTENFSLKEVIGESKVPKDTYFVLGDNRQSAMDSRHYGVVNQEDVIGKVEMGLFPKFTNY
ncbi:signal peptidase I [uncultured Vagococcus sp.]|uniref:signal peptidase I n=1 Tax=uncultured Vagococcus sp. TaxID=189676 RepID=UPI0028D50389|nr:signal peptidase I [uncultured Vagococcus sp.]